MSETLSKRDLEARETIARLERERGNLLTDVRHLAEGQDRLMKDHYRLRATLEDALTSIRAIAMHSTQAEMARDARETSERVRQALAATPTSEPGRPRVICLCGSTRFADFHAVVRWRLEKTGEHVCLMINYFPPWAEPELEGSDHFGEQLGLKETLDTLHLRKIDMADEVLVVDVGGYYGDSTRAEIAYAEKTGKPVRFCSQEHPEWLELPATPTSEPPPCPRCAARAAGLGGE